MPLSAGLDPDADQARELLETELGRAEYNRPESVVAAIVGWVVERLNDLTLTLGAAGGLSQLMLLVVVVVVVLAALFAARGVRRQRRLTTGPDAVLDEIGVTAAEYRARARAALQRGEWDTALLDSYRAIAVGAQERTLLDELPGRTAHEVAVALAPRFPDLRDRLADAADSFDGVRYGDGHVGPDQARAAVDLEQVVARARPVLAVREVRV